MCGKAWAAPICRAATSACARYPCVAQRPLYARAHEALKGGAGLSVPRSVRGCVCSLSESIRLRLATVRETEPALDTLLQLCACMGGSFNHDAVQKVWQALVGSDVSLLNHAIQRGVQLRLLKYVTSAGVTSGAGQTARRRSSATSDVGRWFFHHLRIQDSMGELLLSEARSAKALSRLGLCAALALLTP